MGATSEVYYLTSIESGPSELTLASLRNPIDLNRILKTTN